MITELSNKMLVLDCGTHKTVCDGDALGGCGHGEVGDPCTFLPNVWQDVIDKYEIKSVLDVGCGFGYSTRWFRDNAGCNVRGIEGSEAIAGQAVSEFVFSHDFREGKPDFLQPEFDLGWCSEFLEHVKPEYEPCYMAALTRCKYLLISAALPGFGGHHHVNEQPSEHWIEKFAAYGYEFLQDETNRLRHLAHECNGGKTYFQSNGLFFRKVREVPVPTHWTDLPGPLTHDIAEKLQNMARGRRVLVIGGGEGQMALALGQTAAQVTVVSEGIGKLGPLLANIKTSGIRRIEAEGETLASHSLRDRRFEMVAMCGGGDVPLRSASFATELAIDVMLPGGVFVWEGWDSPGVRESVEEAGIKPSDVAQGGTYGVLETAKWQVMVTLPHSRGVELQAYKSLRTASIGRFTGVVAEVDMDCGCLVHNFNSLLTAGLNWRDEGKATHLAMIHSDVMAERGWVDLLAEEMAKINAVAISAVVAIKDPDDDRTSTAVGSKANPWEAKRYVRIRDKDRMPVTFTGKDVCRPSDPDEVLLINTGLMLIDLRHPFWDTFTFQVHAAILEKDGKRFPIFRPEDWEMSRELDKAGLTYASTWRPYAEHIGSKTWPNRPPLSQEIVARG